MLRRSIALAVLLAAAPGLERPAAALTCVAEPDPPSPYASHRLVFEGVPLSGAASGRFGLDSPARVLVTRWIRGRGPRIVRVETATELGTDGYLSHTPGFFTAQPGTVARLFVDRVRRDGVLRPAPPACDGDERPLPRSPLAPVAASGVRTGGWRAHAERGPHGLRCISLHPVGRHTGGGRECSVGPPVLAVHGEDDGRSTAIAAFGRAVREVELRTPDGPMVVRPRGAGHSALAVLPGNVDPAEVRARVTTADGRVLWLHPAGFATALAPDPELYRPWRSALRTYGRVTCVGVVQLWPREAEPDPDTPEVDGGEVCRRSPFVAIRAARPPGGREFVVEEPSHRVVFGFARRGATITITDPGGVRRLRAGRGGQFVAVYPGTVRRADLRVEVSP